MLATGDDDGVIKVRPYIHPPYAFLISFQLWDPRQSSSVRSYNHHHDFISDFLWLEDKKHLVATRFALPLPHRVALALQNKQWRRNTLSLRHTL
jgi:hypothetical protein